MPLGSPLGRFAHLNHEPDPRDGYEAARAAWHREGLILINPAWLGEWDRQQAVILAEKLFDKRRTGG